MSLSKLTSTLRAYVNAHLTGKDSFDVVVRTAGFIVVAYWLAKIYKNPAEFKKKVLNLIFTLAKKVPAVAGQVEKEKAKAMKSIKEGFQTPGLMVERMPEQGKSYEELLTILNEAKNVDESKYGHMQVSGCIYLGNDDHTNFNNTVYGMFSLSNPLHAEVFPSVRKMEAQVIGMTANMMNGDSGVVGAMTSGGTESILMAIKAYRDWAKDTKGIDHPELVVPVTVHAAFDKACHYFGIKIIHIGYGADFKVDLNQVRAAITKNTIAIVGSAPNFPHGIIDDIQGLSDIALKHNIGLHVDACLGGFVVPFIAQLPQYKNDVPAFDFRVRGVTSMSADTHKYGCTPKGTSVVLFRTEALRNYMFFTCPDWTGGTYGSPTMPGSRPGGLSAAAWASIMHFGRAGYLELANGIMETARKIIAGIKTIPELQIIGDPRVMVVAMQSKELNIFQVNAALGKRGWHLSSLQRPIGIHLSITGRHIGKADELIAALKEAVAEVKGNPEMYKNSSAAMYGMAASLPDRTIVKDLISGVLGAMLDVK